MLPGMKIDENLFGKQIQLSLSLKFNSIDPLGKKVINCIPRVDSSKYFFFSSSLRYTGSCRNASFLRTKMKSSDLFCKTRQYQRIINWLSSVAME